jgi:hypothetical protein
MDLIPSKWRRTAARLLCGFAAPTLVLNGQAVLAAEPVPVPAAVVAPAASPVVVPDLGTARQIALEHQPGVLAARASLAAAVTRRQSLDRLHLAGLVARDLPTRKQQGDLGVQAAAAAVQQAEADTIFSVTYCYLAYEYACMQERLAIDSAKRLQDLNVLLDDTLTNPTRKDVYDEHRKLTVALAAVTASGNGKARSGKQRALAALRDAMGLGTDCVVVVPERDLPEVKVELRRELIIDLAVSRRSEVFQAALGAEVARLEINAQKATFMPTSRTFASGADIHAFPIPPATLGTTYRPGGISIEMPPMMTGHRSDRVEQATELSGRAEAVADRTRSLIALEAEDAFIRWQETGMEAHQLRLAAENADVYNQKLLERFDRHPEKAGISNPTIEDLVLAGAGVGSLRAQVNEARFNHLVALALLERVTAGGVCANFDQPPPAAGK